jgi:hypothetical protein
MEVWSTTGRRRRCGWFSFLKLDRRSYPVGRKVSDQEIATLNLTPHSFHGEWNYLIRPRDV